MSIQQKHLGDADVTQATTVQPGDLLLLERDNESLSIDATSITGNVGAITFESREALKSNTGVAVGNTVKTLGCDNKGDGGAALYTIEAGSSGTADYGSRIDLPGTGLQAVLIPGNHVKGEQFGVVLGANGKAQERSAQFNEFIAFAADLNADTYTGDDGEVVQKVSTGGVKASCHADFTAKDQLSLAKSDGSTASGMIIEMNCNVIAVTGGTLAAHTQVKPLPLFRAKVKNCSIYWPSTDLELLCAGIKLKKDIGCNHYNINMRAPSRYGFWRVAGNDSVIHDPIIKGVYRDPTYTRNGVDLTDYDQWHCDEMVFSTKDNQIRGGQIGWGGPCVRILDTMPTDPAQRIPGQNCYWDGLDESGDGDFLDGDNGGGDVVSDNMHMMQGMNDDFLAISGPRWGVYADYDFATGGMIIRQVDSPIGILSFAKVSNLSFFDRLDNDSCIHLLFGAQVGFTDETPGSSIAPMTASTDTSLRLDPQIRYFANRGTSYGQRYPYMADLHHQRQMTVGFYDNPAEIYWNGTDIVEAATSWTGDWTELNRMNRASGSYSGEIDWQGLLAAGTYTPTVSAAGDFWIAQGAVTVDPGGVTATDGQLIYALVASPAGESDWLVVNPDTAPVRETSRWQVEAKANEYNIFPGKNVAGQYEVTNYIADASFSQRWMVGGGNFVSLVFDGSTTTFGGATGYDFGEELTVTSTGSGNIITGSVSGLNKVSLFHQVSNGISGLKPYDASGNAVLASRFSYHITNDEWFFGGTWDQHSVVARELDFATRAQAVIWLAAGNTRRDGVVFPAGGLEYEFDSSVTAITDMTGVKPHGNVHFEHFGAVGDFVNDANLGTDDITAMQAAFDYVEANGIDKVHGFQRYRTTATLTYPGRGMQIVGTGTERSETSTTSTTSPSVIAGDFTSGPVIWCEYSDCKMRDITLDATATRSAAAVSTGVGGVNAGLLLEPADTSSATLVHFIADNVMVRNQPAGAIELEGPCTSIKLNDCITIGNGRHGKGATQGEYSGRTNTGRPGIITVNGGKSFDNGGHNLAFGHPSSGAIQPYRVLVQNHENYRGASDATMRHTAAACYAAVENFTNVGSASGGTDASNNPLHPCWFVAGRSITFINNRWIKGAGVGYLDIGNISGFSTQDVTVTGGTATDGTPAEFAQVSSNADGIYFDRIGSNVPMPSGEAINILTISGGTITLPARRPPNRHWVIKVDTEASAATDDLTTIDGAMIGDMITLMNQNSGRVVTVKDNTGNLRLAGDFDFSASGTVGQNTITMVLAGTNWSELSRGIV